MQCRDGCGACCIAPSITSPLPGMPNGKPAGVVCVHLTTERRCDIFGSPDRPPVCAGFMAEQQVCGGSAEEALQILTWWEQATA